ncbi:ATP-binding cassette domain-containing protein [Aquamicrobium defluvii]|uniref:Branched-chain amino acid ABC transporter ATP-binding protein n=1 Tax=Aquamicrobium defluvii TaxID=69279 RepID=A0A011U247_9HYPH|nr:ATP-binding cassette domain-containing protein [Aquamicrobium defluvii]EXL10497.1 branched-chain amino acid ABC transporter ATP-binding protein [Aquamicrobium defluvii]EZQ17674.1 branched-chain amino acid ABC transporter ATP-binding protein [Halopseudomonas bauzanensis]TDR37298.1 branched-chain amino acid transport system ATP-binding protein [Aquamicrobium defluvii]
MSATTTTAMPILRVEHLSMKFGGLVAIGDLSFDVRRGEITALIGPNGAGKTTVFNCITGFYKPTEGMIRFTGRAGNEFLLERMPDFQITARAKVARTFQNIRLFSGMTVLENLLVAQHNKLMKASGYTILGLFGVGGYPQAAAEATEKARHWLEKADLIDRADDPAGDLPYGAQRRLEIARAMCTDPELLCLDEPAAGLNPKESLALNALLNDIKDNTGTSILLIEHDMSVVMEISDHIVVLEYGRKISDGTPEEVRTDPSVIAAYLGVDDEEVEEVLIEVGDEDVIEQLDTGPDAEHGPEASASMLAGPLSDTVVHGNGERVTVEKGAGKAQRVKAEKPAAAKPAAKAAGRAEAVATAGAARPGRKSAAAGAEPSRTPAKGAPAKGGAAAGKEQGISNRMPAPRGGKADDLQLIKGIGPVNEKKLNAHGIYHFDQIAAWKKADIAAAEAYLAFDGRIAREDWIGQAKALARKAASGPANRRGGRK